MKARIAWLRVFLAGALAPACVGNADLPEDGAGVATEPIAEDEGDLELADRPAGLLAGTPLRYLAINVGNASLQYGCWEYKLCRAQDVANIRNYIGTWKPDVILLSEVLREAQLTGASDNVPIHPPRRVHGHVRQELRRHRSPELQGPIDS